MISRAIYDVAFSSEWGRQMRFITGPRQAGKTTIARQKLKQEKSQHRYYLWDLRKVKQQYRSNELFFTQDVPLSGGQKTWICFDEIHKMPKWKNILKASFDQTSDRFCFIITGSAKLNIIKRAGDSLAGRYFNFRLMPLALCEVTGTLASMPVAPDSATAFIDTGLDRRADSGDALFHLLENSGFPEPFQNASSRFHKKWVQDYAETVVREDIGSLTRIIDRENIFDLYNLLPEMVGSPVSESSLAGYIQVSPATVKNYLRRLADFYLTFSVRPYSKNIKRSLLKTRKQYLYDWSQINNEGMRFENYVACELMTRTCLWSDATGDNYDLCYVRNKQKQETDFLVTRNAEPWLLLESKLTDKPIEKHHFETAAALNNIPFVQVCQQQGIASMQKDGAFRISASRIFG